VDTRSQPPWFISSGSDERRRTGFERFTNTCGRLPAVDNSSSSIKKQKEKKKCTPNVLSWFSA
jgi:hypothetical protein